MLLLAVLLVLLLAGPASAGLDLHSKDNLAVYWGQNSQGSQGRLVNYCYDPDIDVFLIAFLTSITDGQGNFAPVLNLANHAHQCDQSKSPYICPQMEADIKTCQQDKNKTIILSLGGWLSSEQGFRDDNNARAVAGQV